MAIPDFQTLMLPVLDSCKEGEVKISEVVERLAEKFSLTDEERASLLPSGRQTTFANRTHWAKSYLGKAGLIEATGRGRFVITRLGREILAKKPPRIDIKYLDQFPSFKTFRSRQDEDDDGIITSNNSRADETNPLTPDETMRAAYKVLETQLGNDVLDRILAAPPDFFERLVVTLLTAMGYGGSTAEAARALGKSGDGGVDGVIDQDSLGLDRIYVQAKRYARDNAVGSGAIRDFFGSLDRFKAAKGLFVTTSSFTSSARETADFLSKRIVLVDGTQLTKLMIRHEVGCRVEETLHIKRIDEEFFE
jgi:restriction system protein